MATDESRSSRESPLSRRLFVQRSAMSAVGFAMAGAIPAEAAAGLYPPAAPRQLAGRVVLVRHSRVIERSGRVQQPLLQEMLDRAVTTLTGAGTVRDAWREFVGPDDVIGLKVNANSVSRIRGTELTAHFPAMTSAVLSGFERAGIAQKNVIIWDRADDELATLGLSIRKEADALRVMGTRESTRRAGGPGFSSESYPVGSGSSRVSRIASDMCSALINMPVLKDHGVTGITGALKNHYGSIDNPSRYHGNSGTNPGAAEVNAIPVIREKERLVILDGLLGVYNGGPGWPARSIWPFGGILVGTDPVAVDAIALKILDEKRAEENLRPLTPRAISVDAAAALGLGIRDLSRIALEEITLG